MIQAVKHLPLIVEHTVEQCYHCLWVKFSEHGDFRYCDVVLEYAEPSLCVGCRALLALEDKT